MISAEAEVHVFHRKDDREPFTYAGRATATTTEDVVPVRITWSLHSPRANAADPISDPEGIGPLADLIPNLKLPAESYFASPPSAAPAKSQGRLRGNRNGAKKVDHAAQDARNRNLGRAGEQFVVELERKRLTERGRQDLADKVEWVADTQGDGLGYDVSSFDAETGHPLLIEVKTTTGTAADPFFVTRREIDCSAEAGRSYRLYRVFNYGKEPRVFVLEGTLIERLSLTPSIFEARVRNMAEDDRSED